MSMIMEQELAAAIEKARATDNQGMVVHLDYHARHPDQMTQGESEMIRRYVGKASLSEFLGTILASRRD
jgi:hypothetical protein